MGICNTQQKVDELKKIISNLLGSNGGKQVH